MPVRRSHVDAGRFSAARCAALLLLSGFAFAAVPEGAAFAQAAPSARPVPADPYAGFIADAAQRFGIPEVWIRAVMRVESRGDVRAVSPKGAMGLMQIMPATWAELRGRYGLGIDPYDPRDNIIAGAAYLREMHDRYGSPGFLAAYNAGPGRYEEYRATGRPLPAETRAYVATLVPVIGGGDLAAPVTIATVDPLAWTRAPLFVVQAERNAGAARPQPENTPGASAAEPSTADAEPAAQRSEGLFVLRTASAGPR